MAIITCAWSWAKSSQIKIKSYKGLCAQPHPMAEPGGSCSPSDTECVLGPGEILPEFGVGWASSSCLCCPLNNNCIEACLHSPSHCQTPDCFGNLQIILLSLNTALIIPCQMGNLGMLLIKLEKQGWKGALIKFTDQKGAESGLLWEVLPVLQSKEAKSPSQREAPTLTWPVGALGINDADVKHKFWGFFWNSDQKKGRNYLVPVLSLMQLPLSQY